MDPVPLSQSLTVIITSSAIPSNPSTSVLENVLAGFSFVPELQSCNIILVFDGFLEAALDKPQFKRMRLAPDDANRYANYKIEARKLIQYYLGIEINQIPSITTRPAQISAYGHGEVITEHFAPSLDILHLSTRFGFALAIREALQRSNICKFSLR
jgi:hypothetical protein